MWRAASTREIGSKWQSGLQVKSERFAMLNRRTSFGLVFVATIIWLPSSKFVSRIEGRSWKGNFRSVVRRRGGCIKIYGGEFELRGKSQSRMEGSRGMEGD